MNDFPSEIMQNLMRPSPESRTLVGENFEEILQCYDEMIQYDPKNRNLYLGKVSILQQRNRLSEAICTLDRVLEFADDDAKIWCKKGEVLVSMGQNSEAMKCFRKAVQIVPMYEDAWCRIGELLLAQKDYIQAKEVFQRTLKINLNNEYAAKVLLSLEGQGSESNDSGFQRNGPSNGSEKMFDTDIDDELSELFGRTPTKPVETGKPPMHRFNPIETAGKLKKLVFEGQFYQRRGEYIKALKCFNQALELNNVFWDGWRAKGDLFLEIGKTDEACFCYYKALYLALTPVGKEKRTMIFLNEDEYNLWRDDFFSTMEEIHDNLNQFQ
ncbi:MAG: tetratricopeptide repeat protein [Methanomassiliicoccales archaeon]|nr:MAG: tetratricopeptide repeat protein [Methanomassiliicoccales archaeon]